MPDYYMLSLLHENGGKVWLHDENGRTEATRHHGKAFGDERSAKAAAERLNAESGEATRWNVEACFLHGPLATKTVARWAHDFPSAEAARAAPGDFDPWDDLDGRKFLQ